MRITDNMCPDCISVCFYQIRYEHPHHPQRRYNALHAAACFETKGDFGQEICTHFPKERDDISALSYVNPLVVDDFSGAASNIAGIAVPKLRFQFLFRAVFSDWAVHNRPAGYMCRLFLHKCFSSQKPPAFFGAFILQKIFGKNQCADCSFIGICRKRVRTLRFVLSFLPCNVGFCVFFGYCLIHTQQSSRFFFFLCYTPLVGYWHTTEPEEVSGGAV